jgi:hypothetical protein
MKSPQNEDSKSISMTAPVVKKDDGKGETMSFILPAEYDDIGKVPKPTNEDVSVVELPPQYGAVVRFPGRCKPSDSSSRYSSLLSSLSDDGVEAGEAKWELWQYNPPFTIPWLRRNEVFVELTKEQAEGIKGKEEVGGGA